VSPCARERRETHECPEELSAMFAMFGSDQRANECWRGRSVLAGECFDHVAVDAAHVRRSAGSPIGDVCRKRVKARRVRSDVLVVNESVANQHVHGRKHEGDVGTRTQLDELVGRLSRDGTHRVDDDHPCAVLTRRFDVWPEMSIGEPGVGGPQHYELRKADVERIVGERRSERRRCGKPCCASTERVDLS